MTDKKKQKNMEQEPEAPTTKPRTLSDAVQTGKYIFLIVGTIFVLYVMITNRGSMPSKAQLMGDKPVHKKHHKITSKNSTELNALPDPVNSAPQPVIKPEAQEYIASTTLQDMLEAEQMPPSQPDDTRVLALQARIDALQAAQENAQTKGNTVRLDSVSQVIADLQTTQATMKIQVQQLQQQLQQSQQLTQTQNSTIASLALLKHITHAAQQGDSFRKPLDNLREIHRDNVAIHDLIVDLSGNAATGIYTAEALHQDFNTALSLTIQNQLSESFTGNLKKLVRVRKIGEHHKGNDDEPILARAEAQLEKKNINHALKTLQDLSDAGKESFAPWQKSARDYLQTHNALNKLEQMLMADLLSASTSNAPTSQKPEADKVTP